MWISSTSAIWSPTVMTGLSAVIGSWKIMAMRVPRRSRRRAGVALSTSSPSSSTWPALADSSRGSRPITAWAVTDLPEPEFADDADDLARADREGDVLDGVRAVRAARQADREAFDGEDGGGGCRPSAPHTRLAKRGSSVSRRPSPSMLTASTANARKTPGIEDVVGIDAEERAALGHDVAPGRRLRRDADAEEGQDRPRPGSPRRR